MNKIRPLADKVLVKRDAIIEKTESGIYLTDSKKEKSQTGTVIAVGPGLIFSSQLVPVAVKEEDRVYFGKYAGIEIDKDLLIIKESELLGVIEKNV